MQRISRARLIGCALVMICLLGLGGAPRAIADTSSYSLTASGPMLPADGIEDGNANLNGNACGADGQCVAVGSYVVTPGDVEAYVEPIRDGVPQPGVKVPLPADAHSGSQTAYLLGVSCPSSGPCTAYGVYENQADAEVPIVVEISDGVPATAVPVTLPAGASGDSWGDVYLNAVACEPTQTCVIAGAYSTTATGKSAPLIISVQNGVVQPGVSAALPADLDPSDPNAFLTDIACQSGEPCVAVGGYEVAGNVMPLVLAVTDGTPGSAVGVAIPQPAYSSMQYAQLSDVACPQSGACEAIGSYIDGGDSSQNLVVPITAGAPGGAQQVAAAPNSYGIDPLVQVTGESCSSAALCVATGYYTIDDHDAQQAGVVTITPGGAAAYGAIEPANDYTGGAYSSFTNNDFDSGSSVSCVPSGPCLAVGYYQLGSASYAGLLEQISAGGTLGTVLRTPVPANADADSYALLEGVSCGQAGSCETFGTYKDASGNDEPFVLSAQAPLQLPSASLPGATQGVAYAATLPAPAGAWGLYSWAVSAGSLPAGLSLNPQTGQISGTPTGSGAATFTVTATADGAPVQSASEQLALVIAGAAAPAASSQAAMASLASPHVSLLSVDGRLMAGRVELALGCSGAACLGSVKLELSRVVTLRKGRKRVREHATIALGQARYSLISGTTTTVALRLNGAARQLLAQARHHRLKVIAVAEVSGGSGSTRQATIYAVGKRIG